MQSRIQTDPREAGETGATAGPNPEIVIRPLASLDEYRACEEVQRATWGREYSQLVPWTFIKVSQRVGGIAAGAFDPRGRLVGFVYGITGLDEEGHLVHWSHMLAVLEEAQGRGVGRRLKEYQRAAAARLGAERICWTFDPLVARNAHFNLNRLGVDVAEYVVDMYGDSDSPLHAGLGTDRLVAVWPTTPHPLPARPPDSAGAPIIGGLATELSPLAARPPVVRIEIPPDIFAERATDPRRAAAWRGGTRPAFLEALAHGYRVAGFEREPASGRCFYLLARAAGPER